MKKKRNTRLASRLTDSILFFICGCGILISSLLLWNDMNISFTKSHEEPIALIFFKQNTAQRRLIDRNLWEILHQSSALYNGDRVRTANMSEAVVVFNDGNKIELHENTLIQFFQKKEKTVVSFESGSVSVTTIQKSTDFNITLGANLVNVSPATITNLSSTNNGTDGLLTVMQGSVNVVNDELLSNSAFIQGEQNSVVQNTISKLSSLIQKPFGIQEIESYNSSSIVYSPSMQKITQKTQTLENGETVLLSAEPTKTIERPKKDAPLILSPASTQTILYSKDENPSVQFTWNSQMTLKLVMSSSMDFSQNKTEVELENGNRTRNFTLPFAKVGERYYWYIKADDNSVVSSGTIFVEEKPTQVMYNIAQNVFAEQQAITLSANFEESLGFEQKSKIDKVFEQKSENIIPEITLPVNEIEEKSQESEKSLQSEPKVNEVKTEVASAPKKETPKPAAPKEVFSKAAPTLTSPANKKVLGEADFANLRIDFKWKAVPLATEYDFVLYNAKDRFTPLLKKTLKKAQYVLEGDDFMVLDEGTFVWQVTAKTTKEKSDVATAEFSIALSEMGTVEIDESTIIQR